jgi:hypothetical protein
MTKQFSDEADECLECQARGFTTWHGQIRNPGKFEGEPLAAYHAYHTMLDGFYDDIDGANWRVGNVICYEDNSGFVYATIYDTEEEAIAAWEESDPEPEEEDW